MLKKESLILYPSLLTIWRILSLRKSPRPIRLREFQNMKHNKRVLTTIIILLLVVNVFGATVAQGGRTYTIGYLNLYGDQAFKDEMTQLGYVEGENITYMTVSFENVAPEDFQAQYALQLQAMVDAKVDVFVTNTDTDAMNIKDVTGNTPIVFQRSDDPVSTGAVASLVNPGGTMTGTITNRPHERRLQLLTEVKPTTKKIYYLYSTLTGEADAVLQQVQTIGSQLGIEVVPAPITDLASALTDLENTPEDTDWLFLTPYVPWTSAEFNQALEAQSSEHKAGIAGFINAAIPGEVIDYGPDIAASDRQSAQIVDRILRGASPADLPVLTAENYLTVNLEAAAAINLEIPESVLRQAAFIVYPGYFDSLNATATAAANGGG